MIIMPHPYGRMANRLILATTFIAQTEEYGDSFLHLAFADYFRFFEGTKHSPLLYYRSSNPRKFARTRTFGCVNIWNTNDKRGETYFLNQETFLTKQHDTRCLFVIGWSFRTPDVVLKHKNLIKQLFKPVPKHLTAVEQLADKIRKNADNIVGVHIRQTDYKKFSGGKFLYSIDDYKSFMRQMNGQLPGKTRFLLCSDIRLIPTDFKEFDVFMATGHPVEDNYALATCDYMIGPPSTYTAWASFYGDTPKHFIRSAQELITLDSFNIQQSV